MARDAAWAEKPRVSLRTDELKQRVHLNIIFYSNPIDIKIVRGGDMAQSVQCFTFKHKGLTYDPQLPCKSWALQQLPYGSEDRWVLGPHCLAI